MINSMCRNEHCMDVIIVVFVPITVQEHTVDPLRAQLVAVYLIILLAAVDHLIIPIDKKTQLTGCHNGNHMCNKIRAARKIFKEWLYCIYTILWRYCFIDQTRNSILLKQVDLHRSTGNKQWATPKICYVALISYYACDCCYGVQWVQLTKSNTEMTKHSQKSVTKLLYSLELPVRWCQCLLITLCLQAIPWINTPRWCLKKH